MFVWPLGCSPGCRRRSPDALSRRTAYAAQEALDPRGEPRPIWVQPIPFGPHDLSKIEGKVERHAGDHGEDDKGSKFTRLNDAVEHCSGPVKDMWERELRAMGAWTEPE